jgi:hypothetical protein
LQVFPSLQVKLMSSVIRQKLGMVVFAVLLGMAAASRANTLDSELLRQMPRVMKYLEEKGYRRVGVLTFRLRREGSQPTFQGALINNDMTVRIENAMVLARDSEKPVQVISQARKTAATKLVGANYRTPSDRKRLFDLSYELAVREGNRFVSADAFLTGEVAASHDLATTSVSLECFDRMHPEKYVQILSFNVATDRDLLADMGQGFSLQRRGTRFARDMRSETDLLRAEYDDIQTWQHRAAPAVPAKKTASPVELAVCYDNQPQDLAQDPAGPNNWTVKGPLSAQHVAFSLRNTMDRKVGVVLLVNGYNTLCGEYGLEPNQWSRWTLGPGEEYRVKGFYKPDRKTFSPIEGTALQSSQASPSDFADARGLVHLLVFTEGGGAASGTGGYAAGEDKGNLRHVLPGQAGINQPKTWTELSRQIAAGTAARGGRGAVGRPEDDRVGSPGMAPLGSLCHEATLVIRFRDQPSPWTPKVRPTR